MDKKAETNPEQDAAIQKQKEDERLKELEKQRNELHAQVRQSHRIPQPMEIAQVAAILAQGKTFTTKEAAEPYVQSAFMLLSAAKFEAYEYLSEQIRDVDNAILLHPDDLHSMWAEIDEKATVSEIPVKFDDVLRKVIGKDVRLEDRNKRFRDWLREKIRTRLEKEHKTVGQSAAEVEKMVEAQMVQRLEQLKMDGFIPERYAHFLTDYRSWWALRLSRQRSQRAAKAAEKRWAKSRS